MTSVEVTSW